MRDRLRCQKRLNFTSESLELYIAEVDIAGSKNRPGAFQEFVLPSGHLANILFARCYWSRSALFREPTHVSKNRFRECCRQGVNVCGIKQHSNRKDEIDVKADGIDG